MHILFDATGSLDVLAGHLATLDADPAINGILLLSCADNGFTAAGLNPLLQGLGKPIYGGLFPGIIRGTQHFTRGSILLGMRSRPDVRRIENLSGPETDLDSAIAATADIRIANQTILVIVDGFTHRIGNLINLLFEHLGLGVHQMGCGAGSLSLTQTPCIISNAGLEQDVALLIGIEPRCQMGLAHGWSIISDSFLVTEASHNRVFTLDYQPAAEVYRQAVTTYGGMRPEKDNFFTVAQSFPFGIYKLGSGVVVRDPIRMNEDGSLTFLGDVPEGSFLYLLHGAPEDLVAAASEVANRICGTPEQPALRLIVDCVSRTLFLGDRFSEELAVLSGDDLAIGVLALGEICNDGRDFPEFLNKTAVVGRID